MTLPNGPDGISPDIDRAFPLSADRTDPDQSIANRDTFDQSTVEAKLKQQVRESQGWHNAHLAAYSGLPPGTPHIIGTLAKISEQHTGIPASTYVAQWTADQTVGNVGTVVGNCLAAIFRSAVNIQSFLGSLDFNDPDFDQPNLLTRISERLKTTVFSSQVRAGTNQALDPGFENAELWPTGVAWYAGVMSTAQAHSGDTSRLLTTQTGLDTTFALILDPADTSTAEGVATQKDDRFYAEVWVYPHASNPNTDGSINIKAEFRDSTGVNTATTLAFLEEDQHPAQGVWTKINGYVTVPEGYDQIVPYFWVDQSGTVGDQYYIDDRLFKEETVPQGIITNLIGAFLGGGDADTPTPGALRLAADRIYGQILENTRQLQSLQTNTAANQPGNLTVDIDFGDYPDGDLPSIFTVNYVGSGASRLGITNGVSGWRTAVNDAEVTAYVRYNVAPTNTNFQIVRGTMSQPPQPQKSGGGTPRIWATARVDTSYSNYVWARAYNIGTFTYRADMGCVVGGIEYVWATNIPLSWSMNLYILAGAGTNERVFQLWTGNQLVYSFTENETQHLSFTANASSGSYTLAFNGSAPSATIAYNANAATLQTRLEALSTIGVGNVTVTGNRTDGFDIEFIGTLGVTDVPMLVADSTLLIGAAAVLDEKIKGARSVVGASNRYWGAISEMKTSWFAGVQTPGTISGTSVQDNLIPTVLGSTAKMYRSSTGTALLAGSGAGAAALPTDYFDHIDRQSPDITPSLTDGSFTVTVEGTYAVAGRVLLNNNFNALIQLLLRVNGGVVEYGEPTFPNDSNAQALTGQWPTVYLHVGDIVDLATISTGLAVASGLTGEATGLKTSFSIALVNNNVTVAA